MIHKRHLAHGVAQQLGKIERVKLAAFILLTLHGTIIATSIPRNAVTVDEVFHLPAGMSYWQRGVFWCYHHNPPLVKLAFSLPAVLMNTPISYEHFERLPGVRSVDWRHGVEFMVTNKSSYMKIYYCGRIIVVMISILCGYFVFLWSKELFGSSGGLLSLTLWSFCPDALAHGGLATVDTGATLAALVAMYCFKKYIKKPNILRAVLSGASLGLAETTKFTLIILPMIWLSLVVLKILVNRKNILRKEHEKLLIVGFKNALFHIIIIGFLSLFIINEIYLFEGSGRALGEFSFRSKLLSGRAVKDFENSKGDTFVPNRFAGTLLGMIPVPLPEHYILGLDDQMSDIDGGRYYSYLRGELRQGYGWYYYYLYYFVVKTPLGILALMTATLWVSIFNRTCRSEILEEALLLFPAVGFILVVSAMPGLSAGRYMLPSFPFLFIAVGRLGPLLVAESGWTRWHSFVVGSIAFTTASVLLVHPFYLSYFNEAVGGPRHGFEHLADSSIDWGQGLIDLKNWLNEHAPDREIGLAYYGNMSPDVVDIQYHLPLFGPGVVSSNRSAIVGPAPGLQAISVNYIVGLPFCAPTSLGSQTEVPVHAYSYYRSFRPRAVLSHSIFVYDISLDEANAVRRSLGLSDWKDDRRTSSLDPDRSSGARNASNQPRP